MNDNSNLSQYLELWSGDIEALRQNQPLTEISFLSFARDRGVHRFLSNELEESWRRGWLRSDCLPVEGPQFHPFRIYPFHKILHSLRNVGGLHGSKPELEKLLITDRAKEWNEIADLAILLEPIYWPSIKESYSTGAMSTHDYKNRLEDYTCRALELVRTLDLDLWQKNHESLRVDASFLDPNTEVYVLLRVATWKPRENLRGAIAGALWIRHIAEVVRRGFEEARSVQWLEEDQAGGWWPKGARKRAFGSERPLDDGRKSKPYLAYRFGLFTGSTVRWYVEGVTEYYAVNEILSDYHDFGIELVNLWGSISAGRGNAALRLEAMLSDDQNHRRFSIISFDCDVAENVKTIRRQAEQDQIVGLVNANDPDFEFANFTIDELVEVAAKSDEAEGFVGDLVRNADWSNVGNAKAFEDRYRRVSARKRDKLKGKAWGQALASYAKATTKRSDGKERPIFNAVRAALHSWKSSYDNHKEMIRIHPQTFEMVPRPDEERT